MTPCALPSPFQLAVVVVRFPATPLIMSRVRFCISAGHDPADLAQALDQLEVCNKCLITYNKQASEHMSTFLEQGFDSFRKELLSSATRSGSAAK